MGDPIHLEELQRNLVDPLHKKLLEAFSRLVVDPEKGATDYPTELKAVLEEDLVQGDDALS